MVVPEAVAAAAAVVVAVEAVAHVLLPVEQVATLVECPRSVLLHRRAGEVGKSVVAKVEPWVKGSIFRQLA